MEPTLETNDGFLLVPADQVETGDLITFWSSERESYVTHRVVGKSSSGFITKGDNNPSTDQAAGHPPVTQDAIIGEVLTYGGQPITIPRVGTVVTSLRGSLQGLLVLLSLGGVAWFGGRALRDSRPGRSIIRVRDVLVPLFAVSLVASTGLIVFGAPVYQFTYVVVSSPTEAPHTLTLGDSDTTTVVINRSSSPFTHSIVSTDKMHITNQTRNASTIIITARIPPQESVGRYTTRIQIRRYPAVLPVDLTRQLDRFHPMVPASLTTLVVLLPVYLLGWLVFDSKTPIRPSRSRWVNRITEGFR